MALPIIGSKKRAEHLAELQADEDNKYQNEKRESLRKWEIENSCVAGAVLNTTQGIDNMAFKAELYFKKLDENGLKKYQNLLNNKKLIDKQEKR